MIYLLPVSQQSCKKKNTQMKPENCSASFSYKLFINKSQILDELANSTFLTALLQNISTIKIHLKLSHPFPDVLKILDLSSFEYPYSQFKKLNLYYLYSFRVVHRTINTDFSKQKIIFLNETTFLTLYL